MDYNNMTEDELLERRMELIQIKEGWSTTKIPDNVHMSEIEDEIKIIDEHLKKFD